MDGNLAAPTADVKSIAKTAAVEQAVAAVSGKLLTRDS